MQYFPFNHYYLPGVIGNIVDWYDFTLYAYFSIIFSHLFFVNDNVQLGLIKVFAIFAASYLARPVGACIFGFFGDKYGRRKALIISVSLISIVSFLLGCLPTYKQIGSAAPTLLLLLRVLQGLSAGGEIGGAFVYVMENTPFNQQGIFGAFLWAFAVVSIVLASVVATIIISTVSHPHLLTWGWRIGFWISGFLGLFAFYLRFSMPESPKFLEASNAHKQQRNVLLTLLRSQKQNFICIFIYVGLYVAGFYLTFVYLSSYLHMHNTISMKKLLLINSSTMFISALSMILGGYLADRISYYGVTIIACLGLLLFSYPLYYFMNTDSLLSIMFTQLIFGILIGIYSGPLPAIMIRPIPITLSYSTFAIAFNVSGAIPGGFAPMLAMLLIKYDHNNQAAPSFYLVSIALISFITLLIMRKKKITNLDRDK